MARMAEKGRHLRNVCVSRERCSAMTGLDSLVLPALRIGSFRTIFFIRNDAPAHLADGEGVKGQVTPARRTLHASLNAEAVFV